MVTDKYFIILTTNAKEELKEIYEYISNNLKSKISADNLMALIEDKILRLSIFPYSCMEIRTKPRSTIYRKLIVKNYVILYSICEKNKIVNVVHIYYAKRNYV